MARTAQTAKLHRAASNRANAQAPLSGAIGKATKAVKAAKAPKVSSTEQLAGKPKEQLLDMFRRGGEAYANNKGGGLVWDEMQDREFGECFRIHDGFAKGHYIKNEKVRVRLQGCGAVHRDGEPWWMLPKPANDDDAHKLLLETRRYLGLDDSDAADESIKNVVNGAKWPCKVVLEGWVETR